MPTEIIGGRAACLSPCRCTEPVEFFPTCRFDDRQRHGAPNDHRLNRADGAAVLEAARRRPASRSRRRQNTKSG